MIFNMNVGGVNSAKISNVDLLSANWYGDKSPYSQIVEIEGATKFSQVDLTPSIEQLAIFHHKDLGFVAENENGVVTVYALGQKPENDYTMQVTLTEVADIGGKIIGITVGTTIPKPNYEQTDPTKGDYIKGDIMSAINTDTTLALEGQVADSKAVGDALAQKSQVQIVTWGADD
jgi:hypothetical protein